MPGLPKSPEDVKHDWNKEPGIWFPPWAGLAAKQTIAAQWPARCIWKPPRQVRRGCALRWDGYERALPARGGLGVECQEAK